MSKQSYLIVTAEGQPPKQYGIKGQVVKIGRREGNQILIDNDAISGNHCELRLNAEGTYTMVDSGSTNGTRVNGYPVTEHILKDGDRITLGEEVPAYFVLLAPGEKVNLAALKSGSHATAPAPTAPAATLAIPTSPATPATPAAQPTAVAPIAIAPLSPQPAPTAPAAKSSPTLKLDQGSPKVEAAPVAPVAKPAAMPVAAPVVTNQLKPATADGSPPLLSKSTAQGPVVIKKVEVTGNPPTLKRNPES